MRRGAREPAYTGFIAARQTHLRRIAHAICGDLAQADDLLQNALVKLYVAWLRVRRDGREGAYVRQIMVRSNIDEPATWRREHPGLAADAAARTGLPFEERSALFEALQGLPVMQRKTVVLRHWLGLSVEETAQELDISVGSL